MNFCNLCYIPKKTRIWISHLFYATKHLNMTLTIIFWKTGFWISGIPDPDFKSGPKMSGFSGFSGFFWSVWLNENMPPYLQSLKHPKLIINIFWRLHAIVSCPRLMFMHNTSFKLTHISFSWIWIWVRMWIGISVISVSTPKIIGMKFSVIFNIIISFLASISSPMRSSRVEIKLYKLWSVWVITFLGHNCHFVKNSLIILYVILIQNLQFHTKYEPKSAAVEFFSWKCHIFDEIFA